ncbi:MAG: AAA family ATPase [Chloroflexi bacterium]|nr:AAA family ATPase [Chloroflexota bacterium]
MGWIFGRAGLNIEGAESWTLRGRGDTCVAHYNVTEKRGGGMRITKVKLNNYVCFYDAPEFELGPGINFVVGKNNSGKTAFLDALTPGIAREVHRSTETVPSRGAKLTTSNYTEYAIVYKYSAAEVHEYLYERTGRQGTQVPVLKTFSFLERGAARNPSSKSDSSEDTKPITNYVEELFRCGLVFEAQYRAAEVVTCNGDWLRLTEKSATLPKKIMTLQVSFDRDGEYSWYLGRSSYGSLEGISYEWMDLVGVGHEKVFRFDSDRRIAARLPLDPEVVLKADASNLVQVVNVLQSVRPGRFDIYLTAVKRVLPNIHYLRTVSDGEQHITMYVDYLDKVCERDDLGHSLDKCGTGVAQILAILYVVIVYGEDEPKVIIIDEPHSFLHSSAVRELFRIIEENNHHQYIIATHSPTAIMSVQKKRILLVQREDMVSTVNSVAVDKNEALEDALCEIGAKRSDIFGMDSVVWVEGKTDENCFNLIMKQAMGGSLPFGTNIMGLVNTGDLESRKHAKLAVQVYQKLSGGAGLLPSALGFVFDGDKEGVHDDIDGEVSYLPRQTYENYLLELPAVIADLLNEKDDRKEQEYTVSQVSDWIKENKANDKYYRDGVEHNENTWLQEINGANFIKALFRALTFKRRPYNKAKFGPILTKRILKQKPDHFKEIVDILKPLLSQD